MLEGACHLQQLRRRFQRRAGRLARAASSRAAIPSRPSCTSTPRRSRSSTPSSCRSKPTPAIRARAGPEPRSRRRRCRLRSLYLTDVDEDGLGTLWSWRAGADAAVELGKRGSLDSVILAPSRRAAGLARAGQLPAAGRLRRVRLAPLPLGWHDRGHRRAHRAQFQRRAAGQLRRRGR